MERFMQSSSARSVIRTGIGLPALLLCLASAPLAAAEGFNLKGHESPGAEAPSVPYPLMVDGGASLEFDLGGSETRKLQLQLNQPLSLSAVSGARVQDNGSGLIGLDATLNMPLTDHFSLSGGMGRQLGASRFQALGSVQCMNGILRPDSYTASGCRFVTEPLASSDRQQF
jgi:hypothetical protein